MSPVAAIHCSSLSWFGSLIASRNEVLHWPRSVHGGHHELRQHGQDRKVCWVRSRLGDLKFSESTAWNRDLLNRIVHSTLSRIEWRYRVLRYQCRQFVVANLIQSRYLNLAVPKPVYIDLHNKRYRSAKNQRVPAFRFVVPE